MSNPFIQVGYRAVELHQTILLSLSLPSAAGLTVGDLLQLVDVIEALGLTVPSRLQKRLDEELPPQVSPRVATTVSAYLCNPKQIPEGAGCVDKLKQ